MKTLIMVIWLIINGQNGNVLREKGKKMEIEQYFEDTKRTVSHKLYDENVSADEFLKTTLAFEGIGCKLDDIKKSLYYDKFDLNEDNQIGVFDIKERIGVDTLHGILGIATEGVELIQAINKAIVTKEEFDVVNMKEEIGDIMWYIALLCNTHHIDLKQVMQTNIDKLKQRFPEKFTTSHANNRDLIAERIILESE